MAPYWFFYIAITLVCSLLVTRIAMPVLLQLCKRKGLYDIPDERKIHHTNNIPRLGGMLFVPSMLVGASASLAMMVGLEGREFLHLDLTSMLVLTGMFILYLIGILDDLFGMPATLKFVIQLIVSLFLPFCGLYIHNLYGLFGIYEIAPWIGYPLTIFTTLLIVNAINLIDGIDGLSSSLSLIAILVFGLLFLRHGLTLYVIYCAGLIGSVSVFFYYNMFGNPAKGTKTFMGDTGSLTLGYALSFLAIRYIMTCTETDIQNMHATALLVPYTLLLVPCFDLIRVALMRLKRGVPMFFPDKTHIHHKCMQAGFTMHQALGIIILLQLFYGGLNGGLVLLKSHISIIVSIDVALFIFFNLWLNNRIRSRQTIQKV